MTDKSTNLSKIQREHLLGICSRIKNKENVEITEIIELEQFIKSMKYGLTFERHEEPVDEMLKTHVPVFKAFKEIINNPSCSDCNFLLEGDNLHSLKLLEKTHKGSIDIIYIDPPYNTLNDDFAYGDKMLDENDGFVHSKWLSFMKERLELARKLLTNKGVMFISIDDNEHANLKLLCDGIFGEDCVETYIWNLRDLSEGSFPKTAKLTVRKEHEYIIMCKKHHSTRFNKFLAKREYKADAFSNPDNDPRGPWFSANISRNGIESTTGSKYFEITTPTGKIYRRNWSISKEEYEEYKKENKLYFGKDGNGVPRLKKFPEATVENIQSSLFSDCHTSITGKKQLNSVLINGGFSFPKPCDLIKRFLLIGSHKNATVLDFFAGSGTTGQAILELNQEDGGNRKFILCTNNEISASRTLDYLHNKGYLMDVPTTGKNKTIQNKIDKFFEENHDVYQQLIVNNIDEYETCGICQSVTFPRVQTVITGIRPDGSKYSDGFKVNLKYLQTDMLDKADDDLDELLYEASSYLAELENMSMIDNISICIANCDEDVDDIIANATKKLKEMFIADDVLLSSQQKDFFMRHNVAIKQIPNYYYKEM